MPVPPQPTPLLVRGLMHRNTINPGLQAAFFMELGNPFEHFYENFLEHVRGVSGVSHDVKNKIEDRVLINVQQINESVLRTRLQFRHQATIFADHRKSLFEPYSRGSRHTHNAPKITVPGQDCKARASPSPLLI